MNIVLKKEERSRDHLEHGLKPRTLSDVLIGLPGGSWIMACVYVADVIAHTTSTDLRKLILGK